MRVVLIGVSHWHTPFFLEPCLTLPDVAGAFQPPTIAEPADLPSRCGPRLSSGQTQTPRTALG